VKVVSVKDENQDDKDDPHLTQLQEGPPNCMPKPAEQSSNFPLHQQPYAQHAIYISHLGRQQPPNQSDIAARSCMQSRIPGHMFSAYP
jgi:hypothetical protein